jgi:hypothetical protein
MAPLPSVAVPLSVNTVQTPHAQDHLRLSKRGVNLNPFHYLTLPLKNNWGTVGPKIQSYRGFVNVTAILLGGIALITWLEARKWKPPRWPWAKDGLNNPKPNVNHPNVKGTVESETERLLLEALEEMEKARVEPADEGVREAEEQVMEDIDQEAENIIEESLDNPTSGR